MGQSDAPTHSRRVGGSAHLSSFDERARALSVSPLTTCLRRTNAHAQSTGKGGHAREKQRVDGLQRRRGLAGFIGAGGRRRGGIGGAVGILTGCDQIRQVPWIF